MNGHPAMIIVSPAAYEKLIEIQVKEERRGEFRMHDLYGLPFQVQPMWSPGFFHSHDPESTPRPVRMARPHRAVQFSGPHNSR